MQDRTLAPRGPIRLAARVVAVVMVLATVILTGATHASAAPPIGWGHLQRWLPPGNCLVVQGPNNGAPVFQYTCGQFDDQYWRLQPTGDGWYWVQNWNSGKCLVVQGPDNGARAFQYTCAGFIDQHWARIDDNGSTFRLRNRNSGKCLVVQGPDNGAPAFQYTCGYQDQFWIWL